MPTTPAVKVRGRKPKPITERPDSLWDDSEDPAEFHLALDLLMRRHADTEWSLHVAMKAQGADVERNSLKAWRCGRKTPSSASSLAVLGLIETRYGLAPGTLSAKLPRGRTSRHARPSGVSVSEARRLAWHLPDDFGRRSVAEREEILAWVRTRVLGGGTAYRRYQAEACRTPFSFRFDPDVLRTRRTHSARGRPMAPAQLTEELAALVRFKTATLTDPGYSRSGVWGADSVDQRTEHIALMFGALAAPPGGPVDGLGLPAEQLSLAMLVSPAVWDWYVCWREARRGFYTGWETNMLLLGAALTRREVGWLRQSPQLAARLRSFPGLISDDEAASIQGDWDAACDRVHRHTLSRAREVKRVARIHRDPFEPLLPILEAASPVAEYRRITDEILSRMPDGRCYPRAAAEAARSFLMLRLGLHLGLRQKNLRQMLVRSRGEAATPERELETLKRGELRWSDRDAGWEVFVPCAAFKNADSAYFSRRPFRLLLPDLGELYRWIEAYVGKHRAVLLNGAADPGTFFVKTVKRTSRSAAYDQFTFYEAWRVTIQRYGIYNPYTGRGAIPGLLTHGPHSVRDVLATHVLKQTGSYEQASYAIQDTPATVAKHYGRFLPQDKAALAAKVLDLAWASDLTV